MHCGRTVLAMNCKLAGAQWRCALSLNGRVSSQGETSCQ